MNVEIISKDEFLCPFCKENEIEKVMKTVSVKREDFEYPGIFICNKGCNAIFDPIKPIFSGETLTGWEVHQRKKEGYGWVEGIKKIHLP